MEIRETESAWIMAEDNRALYRALSRLDHNDRRIFVMHSIEGLSFREIAEREHSKEIQLIINSPGGANTAGFAILDAIDQLNADVGTFYTGLAASFGALLLLSGAPGRRFATSHARIMLHQPWIPGEIKGPAQDLAIHAREIRKQHIEINRIIAEKCGRSLEEVETSTDRDFWMDPVQAKDYGVIDAIGLFI